MLNIGSRVKTLAPSSVDDDLGVLEFTVTIITVAQLQIGYVVVEIQTKADSFAGLPDDVPVTHYVVVSTNPLHLFNTSNRQRVCLRNPSQQVHVLNTHGIIALQNRVYEGIQLISPDEDGNNPAEPSANAPLQSAVSKSPVVSGSFPQAANAPMNPYEQGSHGHQLWRMGFENKVQIDAALARTSTVEAAIDWLSRSPDQAHPPPIDRPPASAPAAASVSAQVGGGAGHQNNVAPEAKNNPYPPGSVGNNLWAMGYTSKKIIDESLSRNSTLDSALNWITRNLVRSPPKPSGTFECPVLCQIVSENSIYEFSW